MRIIKADSPAAQLSLRQWAEWLEFPADRSAELFNLSVVDIRGNMLNRTAAIDLDTGEVELYVISYPTDVVCDLDQNGNIVPVTFKRRLRYLKFVCGEWSRVFEFPAEEQP